MNWLEDCISQYYKWLRDNTSYRTDDQTGWSSITTPFMGAFNDPIDIYVKQFGEDKVLLSDDGVTLENLELMGVNVSRSPRRKEWLNYILANYGIKLEDNELISEARMAEFAQKKHNMICAISEISDMEVLVKNTISSLFKEDVRTFFDEQQLIYTPQFITKGKTGIDFTFDFQIAGRTKEVVIKSFNTLNKINVPNFLFSWEDIKEAREAASGKELKGLAIINDTDREVKGEYISALNKYGADCILWSKRERVENLQLLKMVS